MREILRTTDPVAFGYARSLLARAGMQAFAADEQISAMEGSIDAFPKRIMVLDEDWPAARQLLADGGLAAWLIER